MTSRLTINLVRSAAVAASLFLVAGNASALTVAECSAKYKAAKAANTLGGKSWNDFRKSECGDAAAAAEVKPAEAKTTAKKPAAVAAGGVVFPKAVDAQFAKESAGKARLHTCAAQYKANKATNANGGLKWIQKGGGYWSQCNKALKGAA